MRLLLKHIKRSVLRAPKETIILIVTLFLSAILFACIGELNFSIQDERAAIERASYGNADIVVSTSLRSDSRYLTKEEFSEISEDCAAAAGYFILPVYDENGTVLGAAANLYEIGKIFPYSFIESKPVPEAELNSAIFVSARFAKKCGLQVGDSYTVRLLGKEKEYVVYGVNEFTIFGSYDVVVHADGALGALAAVSPVFSLFDGENMPFNELYFRLKEGVDVENTLQRIQPVLEERGYSAFNAHTMENDFVSLIIDVIMFAVLVLSMIIAAVLVWFSLNIVSEKRRQEMNHFRLCGMPERMIFGAFCLEILVYLAIGSVGGIFVARWMVSLVGETLVSFITPKLTWRGIAVCIGSELAVAAVTLLCYRLFADKRKKERKPMKLLPLWVSLALLALSVGCAFIAPVGYKYVLTGLGTVAFFVALFVGIRPLVAGVSRFVSPRAAKCKSKAGAPLFLAVKNTEQIRGMHNVYRILCTVLSVSAVLMGCLNFCVEKIQTGENLFACDYAVTGINAVAEEDVLRAEGTKGCTNGFFGKGRFEDQKTVVLVSVEDEKFLQNPPKRAPEGNGLLISKSVAGLYGYEIGDEVVVTFAQKEYAFVLQGYCEDNSLFAYINAEGCGIQNNVLLVQSDGREGYVQALSKELALYGGAIQEVEWVIEEHIRFARMFCTLMGMYMGVLFTLTGIGCINLIWVSYARRKAHFAALKLSGMTKGDVRRMIAFEGVLAFALVLAVSAFGGGVLYTLFDAGMQSFGHRLF